jgi:predicted nucleic acid-binding protein
VTAYLVDNSIWVRVSTGDPNVAERMRAIDKTPSDIVVTCPPQVLEFCYSAQTPEEHERYREIISLGFPLEQAPDERLVLDIQAALWNAGLVRAAGAIDILIAAYAIANDATVLTADRDFDHIAAVSQLRHEYVAPSDS